jgi:hypothetical protein
MARRQLHSLTTPFEFGQRLFGVAPPPLLGFPGRLFNLVLPLPTTTTFGYVLVIGSLTLDSLTSGILTAPATFDPDGFWAANSVYIVPTDGVYEVKFVFQWNQGYELKTFFYALGGGLGNQFRNLPNFNVTCLVNGFPTAQAIQQARSKVCKWGDFFASEPDDPYSESDSFVWSAYLAQGNLISLQITNNAVAGTGDDVVSSELTLEVTNARLTITRIARTFDPFNPM